MDEAKKKTKRFLIIYCIAIFVFAVALILIASVSQDRINKRAEELQEKLASVETIAADKNTKLDAAMTENQRLTSQIKQLEEANKTLTADKENADKALAATKALCNIINLDRVRNKSELKAAIESFETAGFTAILSPEELAIYEAIK